MVAYQMGEFERGLKYAHRISVSANQRGDAGFIAAGLVFGLVAGRAGYEFKVFFLSCVVVAGVFGALTASRKILYIQAMPGVIGLLLVLFGR